MIPRVSIAMSKLEEVSSKQLVLVDNFIARKTHLLLLIFSMLIGVVYTAFLWLLCSTIPGVASAILLFGSQIAMGFPATRAYYDIGVSNRDNLIFIDPAKYDGKKKHHMVEIHVGEIPLIFEKIDINISKYDKGSLDDLSDLSWFGILVWTAFSSTSFFLGFGGYPLCLLGTAVFLIACFMSYVSGYRIRREYGFEDDLSHLQYFVEKRLKELDTYLSEFEVHIFVHVIERRRTIVMEDFSIAIKLQDNFKLAYHIGFPSNKTERIVARIRNDKSKSVFERLITLPAILENNWYVELIASPTEPILQILNEKTSFSVNNRTSFVTSPSLIDESTKVVADVFSEVLSVFIAGNLS